MDIIQKIFFLLALTQLGACAAVSKTECLNSDWNRIGYSVGSNGNINKTKAFNLREKICAKHGVNANRESFEQGHADGIVQYCQLSNAVQLGVNNVNRAIDNQVCPESKYTGFRDAFNAGNKLHKLTNYVKKTNSSILRLNNKVKENEKDVDRINKKLSSEKSLNKSERKRLNYELLELHVNSLKLNQEVLQYNERLHENKLNVDDYSEYLYQDYLLNLSNEFVDPRQNKESTLKNK